MGRKVPETCRVVIPIKLEFSTSVGFIHKESVTMHGHIVKIAPTCFGSITIIRGVLFEFGKVIVIKIIS
jgi:hypothetical protein